MRAVVCHTIGPPELLEVREVPPPQPGPGEVVVAVRAAGVNFPDALVIQGKYQRRLDPPFSPGGEMAGTIVRLGAGVAQLRVGQPVYGTRLQGSFAEEVIACAEHVREIPAGLSFEQAAVLSTTYLTSYYALESVARLRRGETVLVLGAAGGVGIAAVEIAKALGGRVIAAASSADKLELCRTHGADQLIDYSGGALRERLRELAPNGVDVVYDPVGGAYAEAAMRGLAWRGRYLVVGFAAGEIPRMPLNLVLLKGAAVLGVALGECWAREPATFRQVEAGLAGLVADGRVRAHVTARYPLERAGEALRAMLDRKIVGKVVIVP